MWIGNDAEKAHMRIQLRLKMRRPLTSIESLAFIHLLNRDNHSLLRELQPSEDKLEAF